MKDYSATYLVGRCPFPYVIGQENIPVFLQEATRLPEIQDKLSRVLPHIEVANSN